jgi:D-beta-D-heptose 7-phosphate kinase/D-beta-D-heptose 1-phosphate adenosyltransferase
MPEPDRTAALGDVLSRFRGYRVTVIGDVMLDHFVTGRVERISPEAPVPVLRFERDDLKAGGAANVAHNIRALGGEVALVGLVGKDAAARDLAGLLRSAGIDDRGLVVDADRLTTRKVRLVTTRNQQVARIDYEHDGAPTGPALAVLTSEIAAEAAHCDAVVLSDYRKGVVAPPVIAAALDAVGKTGAPLLVDPKVPVPDRYRGATLITPNHHEAELMTSMTIRTTDDIRHAARRLHEMSGASVLITWGEHGMWVLDVAGGRIDEEHLPAAAREVADVTGAGDTVIAVLALGLAARVPLGDAARLANIAAGLTVARFGPAVIGAADLANAVRRVEG